MKRIVIKFSISRLIFNKLSDIQLKHYKKLANLMIEKRIQDGIHNNPNKITTNSTDTTLSNNDIKVFKYGLKYGAVIRPKESGMK